MTYHLNELEDSTLALPITQTALLRSQQFASGQPTPQKAEQVRLNTLAVCVVNDYLQMLGIPTELCVGDSWNPVLRMCADVADLEIKGVGRLECRPLRKDQQICYVPPEVWSDRIGYIVVQIDETSLEAMVLGFTPTVTGDELPISKLRPVEDFIDHYHYMLQPIAAVSAAIVERTATSLSQWLEGVFETGWQTVETFLNPDQSTLAFNFRGIDSLVAVDHQSPAAGIRRAKMVDLGIQLAGNPLALIVELKPESEYRREITIQVHPTGNQIYLPPQLQLFILDESRVFLEAKARDADNYIQLQFSGLPGELFSVKVTLGDASITEDFTI